MKVWTPIFNIIATVLLVLIGIVFVNVCRVMERDFDQERYNYAVQQATEAMFRSTLHAEDIGLDYTDMSYVSINASDALPVFDRVICANYNMSPSQENFDAINNSIQCCVIAGFDGYYVLETSKSNSVPNNNRALDGYEMKFGIKNPYIYQAYNGKTYTLDIYKKVYTYMPTVAYNTPPTMYIVGAVYPPGLAEEEAKKIVGRQVKNTIIDELQNANNLDAMELEKFRIYFPDETTVTGVNPFEAPGIVMIMGSSNFASSSSISALSVAGYKAVNKVKVIAFTYELPNGTKRAYYCYEGQMRDEEKDAASGGLVVGGTEGKFHIENYYNTIREACEAESPGANEHYAPYYEILTRKITSKD